MMIMSNPLLDKFEEVYGEKPETTEEIIEETTEEVTEESTEYVIPTAQLTNTGITLTGNYVHPNSLLASNSITSSTIGTYHRNVSIPYQTNIEQQFHKVMEDVARGKGVITEIKAEVDSTFTGFGGQIKYTVEILAHYP
jgi:hypothetical protein